MNPRIAECFFAVLEKSAAVPLLAPALATLGRSALGGAARKIVPQVLGQAAMTSASNLLQKRKPAGMPTVQASTQRPPYAV